jgi:cytochrome c oxidase subunit 2
MNEKLCFACHSIDGSASVGPSLKGLYGKKQVVFDPNGVEREVMVDDAYLVRAIQNPGAEEVKGYPAVMPETPMSNADLQEIVDFIKTLKD